MMNKLFGIAVAAVGYGITIGLLSAGTVLLFKAMYGSTPL